MLYIEQLKYKNDGKLFYIYYLNFSKQIKKEEVNVRLIYFVLYWHLAAILCRQFKKQFIYYIANNNYY